MKKSDVYKMFPGREDCPYASEEKYSWNEINNTVRTAIFNILKEIAYEFEQELEDTEEEKL